MSENKTTFESLGQWVKNSITLKLVSITILVLLLLIPTAMIQSIISERESLQRSTTREVSEKWANDQYLTGPILTIPLVFEEKDKNNNTLEYNEYAHILPESLNFDGTINPNKLRRGIYEVVVYKSEMSVKGNFKLPEYFDTQNFKRIKWDDAFLTFGISDLRGIEEQINIDWNGTIIPVTPGSRISEIISSGITVKLPNLASSEEDPMNFSFTLKLQGSSNMSFLPLGSETNVTVNSDWNAPSFEGAFLPDDRSVNDQGFTATWKVLQLNRNFPQHWIGNRYANQIYASRFGVNLLLPLDDYQKTMRSAKYAILTIGLTFLVFFLVEVMTRRKIHPFQYTLVGLALSLFYILLLSISEHFDFNLAYLASSLGIIAMVGLYSFSVFKKPIYAFLLILILSAVYGFLFVLLQLADYALLMGSLGMAVILALVMYFTRNIDWYGFSKRERKEGEMPD